MEDCKRNGDDSTRKAHDSDGPQSIGARAEKGIPRSTHDRGKEREPDDQRTHRGEPGDAIIIAAAFQASRIAASHCPLSAIRVAPSMSISNAAALLSARSPGIVSSRICRSRRLRSFFCLKATWNTGCAGHRIQPGHARISIRGSRGFQTSPCTSQRSSRFSSLGWRALPRDGQADDRTVWHDNPDLRRSSHPCLRNDDTSSFWPRWPRQ
jgi:hypothetical protein